MLAQESNRLQNLLSINVVQFSNASYSKSVLTTHLKFYCAEVVH